jgi:hypothetical protein
MTAREFLVVYDYGMGGLWPIMIAPSVEAIAAVHPELAVAEERPAWMDDEHFALLRDDCLEMESAPRGILNAVLVDRKRLNT